ncbi:thioredoxin-dependent thiol peroxidase [Paenibacillus lutrae]|uniref:thioredoxin-dependent peroxiredoxin n=1 Tax=Paenibacillus lutrae TaxID=2078573 RepID=A0A7X3FH98_9BACL|nr:thioredoxin-dependent thiol peroxidase [Paenibacillus lutrae]MVO99743.1 thioredoxin-dependent thiol peroxidase [Paenibacillus lutrae]
MTAELGKGAPDFELPASNGEKVKLSDFRGKKVILYFYPKDMTPGCTTQACDFRDKHSEFSNLETVILGVSIDSLNRHEKFISKYELPFLLLADEEHTVADLYNVWVEKNMYGKKFMGIERSTFVIDEQGVLVKQWRKVKVKGHIEEALSYIGNLPA